jgi:hypothetical protein
MTERFKRGNDATSSGSEDDNDVTNCEISFLLHINKPYFLSINSYVTLKISGAILIIS